MNDFATGTSHHALCFKLTLCQTASGLSAMVGRDMSVIAMIGRLGAQLIERKKLDIVAADCLEDIARH